MISKDSQQFDSYLPVYDVVPEKWDDARPFFVETLKKISEAVNVRQIGWFLDQELVSGKQFFQSPNVQDMQEFRTIFRNVIDFSPLAAGVNTQPHGLTIDANFSLMQLYAAGTDAIAFTGEPIPNGADTISYNATNIIITVAKAYTRAYAVIEYIQEL
jgi:hypothetical protein